MTTKFDVAVGIDANIACILQCRRNQDAADTIVEGSTLQWICKDVSRWRTTEFSGFGAPTKLVVYVYLGIPHLEGLSHTLLVLIRSGVRVITYSNHLSDTTIADSLTYSRLHGDMLCTYGFNDTVPAAPVKLLKPIPIVAASRGCKEDAQTPQLSRRSTREAAVSKLVRPQRARPRCLNSTSDLQSRQASHSIARLGVTVRTGSKVGPSSAAQTPDFPQDVGVEPAQPPGLEVV